MKTPKIALLFLGLGLMTVSCEKEMDQVDLNSISSTQNLATSTSKFKVDPGIKLKAPVNSSLIGENLRDYINVSDAVTPSTCGPNEFVAVQNKYLSQLGQELVPAMGVANANYYLGLYMDINFISAYMDVSEPQYFGEKGEYTNFMTKRKRELESFWNMPGQIRVNGQHNATLLDRERVAYVLYNYFNGVPSMEFAYEYADYLNEMNEFFSTLPESPFFSLDGFATSGNLIVIGDGLVKLVSEAGIDPDIVWTGVLAHEWAHQIQFDNYSAWYPRGAGATPAEATRYTELEADFTAAYYMTHKRGATYNWKRVEQFFNLFFQIGDCSFTSSGHHGTPLQRQAAARLGYELANSAQKQGHILTPQQVHEAFVASIETVL